MGCSETPQSAAGLQSYNFHLEQVSFVGACFTMQAQSIRVIFQSSVIKYKMMLSDLAD